MQYMVYICFITTFGSYKGLCCENVLSLRLVCQHLVLLTLILSLTLLHYSVRRVLKTTQCLNTTHLLLMLHT